MTCTDAQSHILKRKFLTFASMTNKALIYLDLDIFCPALNSNFGGRLKNLIIAVSDLAYTYILTCQFMYLKFS